tara:strand:+ start:15892 stop:16023 length:132 start_codon:yes stop_codon:yes gene_type:complete
MEWIKASSKAFAVTITTFAHFFLSLIPVTIVENYSHHHEIINL